MGHKDLIDSSSYKISHSDLICRYSDRDLASHVNWPEGREFLVMPKQEFWSVTIMLFIIH